VTPQLPPLFFDRGSRALRRRPGPLTHATLQRRPNLIPRCLVAWLPPRESWCRPAHVVPRISAARFHFRRNGGDLGDLGDLGDCLASHPILIQLVVVFGADGKGPLSPLSPLSAGSRDRPDRFRAARGGHPRVRYPSLRFRSLTARASNRLGQRITFPVLWAFLDGASSVSLVRRPCANSNDSGWIEVVPPGPRFPDELDASPRVDQDAVEVEEDRLAPNGCDTMASRPRSLYRNEDVSPPSTISEWPVTYEDASEQSQKHCFR